MAWRLADFFIVGYLNNTKRNSTHGVVVLHGREDHPVSIQLTGNMGKSLRGRAFEFKLRVPLENIPPLPKELFKLPMQVGITDTIEYKMVKVLRADPIDVMEGRASNAFDWVPTLYLSWNGQNGRMVLELVDPEITLCDGEPIPTPEIPVFPPQARPEVTILHFNDEGEPEAQSYKMKDPAQAEAEQEGEELEAYLDRLNRETEQAYRCAKEQAISEMEMEMLEPPEIDENSELLGGLLQPKRLPAVHDVDEDRAEELVKMLLAEIAMHGVAVHLCEHCTQRDAYAYILNDIIQEGRVPPGLAKSGWTQNYDYGETCPECLAEFEERWARENPKPEPPVGE